MAAYHPPPTLTEQQIDRRCHELAHLSAFIPLRPVRRGKPGTRYRRKCSALRQAFQRCRLVVRRGSSARRAAGSNPPRRLRRVRLLHAYAVRQRYCAEEVTASAAQACSSPRVRHSADNSRCSPVVRSHTSEMRETMTRR